MWAAQDAFTASSCGGGLSVNTWCAAARDECCGLCQVIPITGPGTVFAAIFGSLMNLCMALNWRSETSYTLAVQLFAADGAVISLIDRYFEPKNRLSLFHFCWVPMTALSCIPIVVGMSITRLRYVHGLTQLGEKGLPEPPSHGSEGRPSSRSSARKREAESEAFEDPVTRYGNRFLTQVALWTTLGHLIFFTGAFTLVYASVSGFSQENCIDKHNLQGWRIRMAVFTTVFLVIGYLFWFALLRALNVKRRRKTPKKLPRVVDGLDIVVWLFCAHLHSPATYTPWLLANSRRKNFVRWAIALTVWLGWAIGYIWMYIQAGNEFLMQGSNPWPYEQISAAFSVLAPLCLASRAYFEARDGYDHERVFAHDSRSTRLDRFGRTGAPHGSSESEPHEEVVRASSSRGPTIAGSRRHFEGFMSGGLPGDHESDRAIYHGRTAPHRRASSPDSPVSPRSRPRQHKLIGEEDGREGEDGDSNNRRLSAPSRYGEEHRHEERDDEMLNTSRTGLEGEHEPLREVEDQDKRPSRSSSSATTSLRRHIGIAQEWLKQDKDGREERDEEQPEPSHSQRRHERSSTGSRETVSEDKALSRSSSTSQSLRGRIRTANRWLAQQDQKGRSAEDDEIRRHRH